MDRPSLDKIVSGATQQESIAFHLKTYSKPPKNALLEFYGNYSVLAHKTARRLSQRRQRRIRKTLREHTSLPMIRIDDL